jgi:long-chain fatty acid transport protein
VLSTLASGVAFRMTDDSPITFGIGVFGFLFGGVNFPGSLGTPVLGPHQPPRYFGVGPIFSNMSLLAVMPSASVRLTDRLSVAAGPVITTGPALMTPAFFAPGLSSGPGLLNFPPATNGRPFWGGGFQVGLLFELNDDWNFGFSYKSPVWQERWHYNSYNPDLSPRRIAVQASLPEIISWGVAYKGFEKTIIDVDLRYFDYANAELFGQKLVDGGLNWKSVFAVATGVRYQATDRVALMAGYLFNTNPIVHTSTLFNVQVPGFMQHMLSVGTSMRITDNVTMSAAWQHNFRNAIEGPILQIPGSSTRIDAQLDSILVGLNVTFGGSRRKALPEPCCPGGPDGLPPLP